MENTNTLSWSRIRNIAIVILVLGIISFFVFECHRDIVENKPTAPKDPYKYETTQKYKDEYFKLRDSLKNIKPAKPIIITDWLSPEPVVIDSVRIINDYLRLNPRGKEIVEVKPEFIINYPDAPKFINMDLVKDSLALTFYNKENRIYTENYPLYLEDYGYSYHGGSLNFYDIEKKPLPKPKMKWNQLFLNGGYDVYTKAPTAGFEYNLNAGRFKLDLNSELLILEQPKLNVGAKLGYRLLK